MSLYRAVYEIMSTTGNLFLAFDYRSRSFGQLISIQNSSVILVVDCPGKMKCPLDPTQCLSAAQFCDGKSEHDSHRLWSANLLLNYRFPETSWPETVLPRQIGFLTHFIVSKHLAKNFE